MPQRLYQGLLLPSRQLHFEAVCAHESAPAQSHASCFRFCWDSQGDCARQHKLQSCTALLTEQSHHKVYPPAPLWLMGQLLLLALMGCCCCWTKPQGSLYGKFNAGCIVLKRLSLQGSSRGRKLQQTKQPVVAESGFGISLPY